MRIETITPQGGYEHLRESLIGTQFPRTRIVGNNIMVEEGGTSFFGETQRVPYDRPWDLKTLDNAVSIPAWSEQNGNAVIIPLTNEDRCSRVTFANGLQAVSRIRHPAFLQAYGLTSVQVGNISQPAHIVEAPKPGMINLFDHLESNKAFSLERYIAIVHNVAEAIDYLHAQRVIHLHVRPTTVWAHPETGEVQIAGYQYARSLGESIDDIPLTPEEVNAPIEFRMQSIRTLMEHIYRKGAYRLIDPNLVARLAGELTLHYKLRTCGDDNKYLMENVTDLTVQACHTNVEKRFHSRRDYAAAFEAACR